MAEMLRGVVICPDLGVRTKLQDAFGVLPVVSVVRAVDHYPTADELSRILRAGSPDILFISLESLAEASRVFEQAEAGLPGIQTIAIGPQPDPAALLSLMRRGIREVLSHPFERCPLLDALARAKANLDRHPVKVNLTDRVFTFLPAKPGVGATTLAASCALALSRQSDHRSLLIDCDLGGGMLRFLLQLEGGGCLADAADHARELDDLNWQNFVIPVGNLDVIHSGRIDPERRIEPSSLRYILEFARRNYNTVLLDLSGNMERFALEALEQSKQILLVVTPELPAMHLGRDKLQYLRARQIDQRVVVLLNRAHKRSMKPAQVKELLQCPVLMTFANDYAGVQRTMSGRDQLDPESDLALQISNLAQHLSESKPAPAAETRAGLWERLGVGRRPIA